MSAATLRIFFGLALMLHGIGHALAVLPLADVRLSDDHSFRSWILDPLVGPGAARGAGIVFWTVPLAAFIAAGLGLMGWLLPQESWGSWAVLAATVSLVALVAFWNGLPFFFPNKVGVLVVDLCVLASVLWLRWPGPLFSG